MAKKYGVGLKEHNGDYLDDVTLLEHIPSQITATNIAPQYGTEETRAYMNLAKAEAKLVEYGLVTDHRTLAISYLPMLLRVGVGQNGWLEIKRI